MAGRPGPDGTRAVSLDRSRPANNDSDWPDAIARASTRAQLRRSPWSALILGVRRDTDGAGWIVAWQTGSWTWG